MLIPHIESLIRQMLQHLAQRASAASEAVPRRKGSVTALVAACAAVTLLTWLQYPRQATLQVDRGFYPVSALQYMADHRLGGRVLVTFNWAQYALASFAHDDPDSRIAIDGRFRTCYPQDVIDMYFDFILGESPAAGRYREAASGPFDPTRALEYQSPQLVLLERHRHPQATRVMRSATGWSLLYRDSLAELWGRSDVYDRIDSPQRIPESQRHVSDDIQAGTTAWPAFPVRMTSRHDRSGGA